MSEPIGHITSIMSAYGHQMERESSGRSLSSRGNSETERRGSHIMESGFYIASYAATIMISSLLIVGVLLITLIISLATMLQSCEIKSKGIIEKLKENEDYHYCKIYYHHADLNGLNFNDLPEICKEYVSQYIKEGQYERDLRIYLEMAESYFAAIRPVKDARDVVLIDIDDFLRATSHSNNELQHRFIRYADGYFLEDAIYMNSKNVQILYTKLKISGWPLVLSSRNPEKQRNSTSENLVSNGFSDWSSLVLRSEDEMEMENHEYFAEVLNSLKKQGFRLSAVISCRKDILTAAFSGTRLFRLPDPMSHAFGFSMY